MKGLIILTGDEYAKLLMKIKKIDKIEWAVKGDLWDADICKLRVYTGGIVLDLLVGYPKSSGVVNWYDCFIISYILWKVRTRYGAEEPFRPIIDRDKLVDEINRCIQLSIDNGATVNFNIDESMNGEDTIRVNPEMLKNVEGG